MRQFLSNATDKTWGFAVSSANQRTGKDLRIRMWPHPEITGCLRSDVDMRNEDHVKPKLPEVWAGIGRIRRDEYPKNFKFVETWYVGVLDIVESRIEAADEKSLPDGRVRERKNLTRSTSQTFPRDMKWIRVFTKRFWSWSASCVKSSALPPVHERARSRILVVKSGLVGEVDRHVI